MKLFCSKEVLFHHVAWCLSTSFVLPWECTTCIRCYFLFPEWVGSKSFSVWYSRDFISRVWFIWFTAQTNVPIIEFAEISRWVIRTCEYYLIASVILQHYAKTLVNWLDETENYFKLMIKCQVLHLQFVSVGFQVGRSASWRRVPIFTWRNL